MNESTIEEIKDRLNIVDVVSSYISVKKSGANYKAVCPFHNDKTPSLMISSAKQIWHCFGCGEGGNVFGFVMKYENIDFPEALQLLADRAGVVVPKFSKKNNAQDKQREILERINELAAKFYNQVLQKSSIAETARNYIKYRGLTDRTVAQWQIGYAPEDFHTLENFLVKKGYTEKDLLAAGVSSSSNRGGIYDRFVNRVTFPIKNYAGNTVAFTARVLDTKAETAKYINSPETLIYNKGKIIFGLYQAKQEIRKADCAVVVEGNLDVIACHEAGFKNVVGSSGTAFTYDQLVLLSRLTKNLKFAFDADDAGIIATRRALDLALELGFNVYIVKIDGAKDPDELIRKDPKLFERAVSGAPLYLDYFFEKSFEKYDPTSITQKKNISKALIPLIEKLSDPLETAHYVRILSQRLGVPEKTIHEMFVQNQNAKKQNGSSRNENNPRQYAADAPAITPILKTRSSFLEEKIIGYALFNKEYRQLVCDQVRNADFKDPNYGAIFDSLPEVNSYGSVDEFLDSLKNISELGKLALFMVESEYSNAADDESFDREFMQTLKEFKTNAAKLEMSTLVNMMVKAEQQKDKDMLAKLNQKFLDLSKILNDYKL